MSKIFKYGQFSVKFSAEGVLMYSVPCIQVVFGYSYSKDIDFCLNGILRAAKKIEQEMLDLQTNVRESIDDNTQFTVT